MLNRPIQFFRLHILHSNDPPHRIALGVALGLFVACIPAPGLLTLTVLGLATLLRANKFAALACVWLNNPFTIIPIYYSNYLVGRMVLKFLRHNGDLSKAQIQEMFNQFESSALFTEFFRIEFWQNVFTLLWEEVPELWLGGLIISLLIAPIGYFATYHVTTWRSKNFFL